MNDKKGSKFQKQKKHFKKSHPRQQQQQQFEDDPEELAAAVKNFDWSNWSRFEQLPISMKTKRGLRNGDYEKPTEIQSQSLGLALDGNDVLGAAKTGSGKTLAFLIPMLECLYRNQWSALDGVGALIISPTRELSYQIFEVLKKIGTEHDFSAGLIIGGKDLNFERKRLDRCNIIVCTPGRLLQHMDENHLFNCDNLKMLILDEADRILDLGFARTMNAIIENLPVNRQTLLFSATQTKSVKDLARLSLKNPVYVSSHEKEAHCTPETLQQSYIICNLEDKINFLWSFIKQHTKSKMIVFFSSCKQVKFVYELFCHLRPGIPLLALYGTLHQMRRMSIYDRFCEANRMVLFATDIASRGLDFPLVDWVVQADCPEDVSTYIHRVGRTARMESGGESLLVLLPHEEEHMIESLNARRIPIDKISVNPNKLTTIDRKIEAYLAREQELKESAQRAFKAYVKNYFLMSQKEIFQFDKLDLTKFARSFGLVVTPRVRFVERKLVAKDKEKKVKPKKEEIKKKEISKDEMDLDDQLQLGEEPEGDDDDLFQVKSTWTPDTEDTDKEPQSATTVDKLHKIKSGKSKATLAKRLLKKNIQLNTKIRFDDNLQPVLDPTTQQTSELVKELDKVASGIDIEIVKKVMEEEDKIDKKHYRELIKEKHRAKKAKLKEEKAKKKRGGDDEEFEDEENEEEDADGVTLAVDEGEDSDQDYDSMTQKYIDELPDPDEVHKRRETEDDDDDDEEEMGETRKRQLEDDDDDDDESYGDEDYEDEEEDEVESKQKKKKSKLELSSYEDMALKLLGRR